MTGSKKCVALIAVLVHIYEVIHYPLCNPIGNILCHLGYADKSITIRLTKSFTFRRDDIYKLFVNWKNGVEVDTALNVYSLNKKYEIMHCAAEKTDTDLIEWMLNNWTVEVDLSDSEQKTALHLAAETGSADLVRFLLQRGASPFVVDSLGRTPFDLAFDGLHFHVSDLLLPKLFANRGMFGGWMLILAVCTGQKKSVEYLLKYVDTTVVPGGLRLAARKGYVAIVETILLSSPTLLIDERNSDGERTLSLALKNNHPEVVEKLLAAGANVDEEIVDLIKKKKLQDYFEGIKVMKKFYHSIEEQIIQ